MRSTIDSLFTQRYGPSLAAGAPIVPAFAGRGSGGTTITHGDSHGDTYVLNIDGVEVTSGDSSGKVADAMRTLLAASGVAVDVAHAGAHR